MCTIILPSISASFSATILTILNPELAFFSIYRTWMLSAGLGILFVAPLILSTSHWLKYITWSKIKEHYLLWILIGIEIITIALAVLFFNHNSYNYLLTLFIAFPLLIVAAIKFGLFGAVLFSSILIILTVQLTSLGFGPFTHESMSNIEAVIKVQIYLVLFVISSLFTAVATENIRSAKNKIGNAKKKLQLIFDTLPHGIQENSIDGIITYSNPAHHRILGYKENELIGKPIWFAEEDQNSIDKLKNHLNYLVSKKPKPESYITANYKSDGSLIWLEIKWDYQFNTNGELIGFISIISDISERKLSKETLQLQLKKNKKIIQTALDGYILANQNGKIIDVNPSYCQLIGYSYDELLNMSIMDLEQNLTPNEINQRIKRVLTRKTDRFETMHTCKNSKSVELDVSISVLEQNKDEFLLAAFVRDITNQKELTKELTNAKEKAEESDKLKSEFLKNMSHEIRTPLNGILGFTAMLNEPNISNTNKDRYIEIINKCGDQLLKIIDDILEIAFHETDQIKIHTDQFILMIFLSDLIQIFEPKVKMKNLQFRINTTGIDKTLAILTDKEKLFKIISNLLDNAIKFTTIGFIELDVSLNDKMIKFAIKDSGIGINVEHQSSIFNRFTQEVKDLNSLSGGLGLGLAIAKENTILLGGTIEVKSEKGKGSTFTVKIPHKISN